jgi:hypothetical protein
MKKQKPRKNDGFVHEKRFVDILNASDETPNWFEGAVLANYLQDHFEKTDAVVRTKGYGDFRFQIKSGNPDRVKDIKAIEEAGAILFFVKPAKSDISIVREVVRILRKRILRIRRGEAKPEILTGNMGVNLGDVWPE